MNDANVSNAKNLSSATNLDLDYEVVIIGSGFSGLGAAYDLKKMGIDNFLIIERESELGGTWVQHDYPGLEVDMPFFIYSFAFEPKSDWSQLYPTGKEMRAYTRHVIDKYDFARHGRCNTSVKRAEFDSHNNVWRLAINDGEQLVCRYLVNAVGLLVEPKTPDIQGIENFQGKIIQSARWDHNYDLNDKRVAVIGTGATAIQLVPAIADKVKQLQVFQRTAIWLLPKPNPKLSAATQQLFKLLPFLQIIVRWLLNIFVEISMGLGMVNYTKFPWIFNRIEKSAVRKIREEVDDPKTQDKLIPDYSFFCKRPSFSNTFYQCFNRDKVNLVTDGIERISENGVVAKGGQEHEVDTIILATGYNVFNRKVMPGYELIGLEGVDLGEYWESNRYQAFEGATVPGFPNLFLYMGPYSGAGASYFSMIDTQGKHMTRCLKEARRRSAHYIEVKRWAHEKDFDKVLRRRKRNVLFGGNCAPSNSYYFDEHGDAPGLRPVTGFEHWLNSRFFSMNNYIFKKTELRSP